MAQDRYLGVSGELLNAGGETPQEQERIAREMARREEVVQSRLYYAGEQYERINFDRAKAARLERVEDLPEHEKLHAYSTQLQEGIDFIAAQMADGFGFEMDDEAMQKLLLTAMKRSPDLSGGYGENDLSLTNTVRDALIAMDTPVQVRWDPVAQTAWPEYWESEQVEFVYDDRDRHRLVKVITKQSVWDFDILGYPLKKVEVSEWENNGIECVKRVYFEGEEEFPRLEPLGFPMIPWTTLRATRKQSRNMRGESMITLQSRRHADRYNALEQCAYLIARYNSHGNIAVIGDGATLKAQMDERINKDVADILTFPGGTALQVLTLPTDPQMILHQRNVLIDSMFGAFGLARIDQETLTGLGQVTGYALEILNRKSDGTFAQIKNQYIGDFKRMLNLILDVTAYKAGEAEAIAAVPVPADVPDNLAFLDEELVGETLMARMDAIDPLEVFPEEKRVFKIHLGSGYVVDRTMLRDDFTAGLISRAEFQRQSGYSKDEIDEIEKEIEKEKPPAPEMGLGADGVAAGAAAIAAAGGLGKRGLGAPSDKIAADKVKAAAK